MGNNGLIIEKMEALIYEQLIPLYRIKGLFIAQISKRQNGLLVRGFPLSF